MFAVLIVFLHGHSRPKHAKAGESAGTGRLLVAPDRCTGLSTVRRQAKAAGQVRAADKPAAEQQATRLKTPEHFLKTERKQESVYSHNRSRAARRFTSHTTNLSPSVSSLSSACLLMHFICQQQQHRSSATRSSARQTVQIMKRLINLLAIPRESDCTAHHMPCPWLWRPAPGT